MNNINTPPNNNNADSPSASSTIATHGGGVGGSTPSQTSSASLEPSGSILWVGEQGDGQSNVNVQSAPSKEEVEGKAKVGVSHKVGSGVYKTPPVNPSHHPHDNYDSTSDGAFDTATAPSANPAFSPSL